MSLINDALKRAESEKRAAQSSATPPLQPVESAASNSTSPLLLGGVFLLGLGAIGIAAALWFGGRPNQVVQTAQPSTTIPAPTVEPTKLPANREPEPAQTLAIAAPAQPAPTIVTSTPVAVASRPQQPTSRPVAATAPSPTTTKSPTSITPATSTTESASAQTKPIRLQSIFYRLKNPTVIINGKTLGVGDTHDGIKVVSIQRTSVEIVQNGKYRTLTLQD